MAQSFGPSNSVAALWPFLLHHGNHAECAGELCVKLVIKPDIESLGIGQQGSVYEVVDSESVADSLVKI